MTGPEGRGSLEREPEVMVVDDDRDWGFLVELALGFEGFRVVHASSGDEALAMLDEGEPDAIVLDIGLPGIDGWDATRQLKNDATTTHIPIIVLSAHAMTGDREKALAAGANDFDAKPIQFQPLLKKIELLLTSRPMIQ